uniref:Taste receptor type 2 n=1 Tax=Esox lucius TaxID=8010 RepID=A0A6Q2XJD0_ESOLU
FKKSFCLSCPRRGSEGLKPPLKILLGSLVFCTTIFLLSLIVDTCVWLAKRTVIQYVDPVVSFTKSTSMSASVWLNFFYYTQIVPAQQVIFIYMKKNIKIIIYCALFVDRVFFLFNLSVNISFAVFNSVQDNDSSTYTSTHDTAPGLYYTFLVCSYSKMIYEFLCLCIMVGSSCATVCYLRGHIKSMEQRGSPFTSPHLHNQMRVTITGISQGILYFICALWTLIGFFMTNLSSDFNVFYTILNFTSFNRVYRLCCLCIYFGLMESSGKQNCHI